MYKKEFSNNQNKSCLGDISNNVLRIVVVTSLLSTKMSLPKVSHVRAST